MIDIENMKKIESILLCKVNKTIIGELSVDFIESEKRSLNEISTIELKIPKFITDRTDGKRKEYPLYKEIKAKRYILVDEKEYFIIEKIKENKRKTEKTVTLNKGEFRLSKLNCNLEDIYVQLMTSDLISDVYSINDLMLSETGWSFGHIDDTILYEDIENEVEKLRMIDNFDSDWYDFITNKVAEIFSCFPFFDTFNKKVDLRAIENVGEEIKLCLSYDNYMKELETVEDSTNFYTRLVLINDNLDIPSATNTGYNHLNNFDYFIENNEMSDELISDLTKYEEMVTERTVEWNTIKDEKLAKQREYSLKQNEWLILVNTINALKKQISDYKLLDDSDKDIALKEVELTEKIDQEVILRDELRNLEQEIELLTQSIDHINSLCKYESCTDENGQLVFTQETLDELKEFIFYDTYKEDNFTKAEDMIEVARRKLELDSRPTKSYEIDVFNFMERIIDNNFRQHWNGTLSFGDIIILLDDDGNEDFVYFIGYEYNYKSKSLGLTLSNKKQLKDGVRMINDWRKDSERNAKIMKQNNYIFNDVKKNRLNMQDRII